MGRRSRRARRGSASSSTTRRSSRATMATGSRTSSASALHYRACRYPSTSSYGDDRGAAPAVRWTVVGAGAWGSSFAKLLLEREHEVTLACRSAEVAAAIATSGRNERYLPGIEPDGVVGVTIEEAPLVDADVIVV